MICVVVNLGASVNYRYEYSIRNKLQTGAKKLRNLIQIWLNSQNLSNSTSSASNSILPTNNHENDSSNPDIPDCDKLRREEGELSVSNEDDGAAQGKERMSVDVTGAACFLKPASEGNDKLDCYNMTPEAMESFLLSSDSFPSLSLADKNPNNADHPDNDLSVSFLDMTRMSRPPLPKKPHNNNNNNNNSESDSAKTSPDLCASLPSTCTSTRNNSFTSTCTDNRASISWASSCGSSSRSGSRCGRSDSIGSCITALRQKYHNAQAAAQGPHEAKEGPEPDQSDQREGERGEQQGHVGKDMAVTGSPHLGSRDRAEHSIEIERFSKLKTKEKASKPFEKLRAELHPVLQILFPAKTLIKYNHQIQPGFSTEGLDVDTIFSASEEHKHRNLESVTDLDIDDNHVHKQMNNSEKAHEGYLEKATDNNNNINNNKANLLDSDSETEYSNHCERSENNSTTNEGSENKKETKSKSSPSNPSNPSHPAKTVDSLSVRLDELLGMVYIIISLRTT